MSTVFVNCWVKPGMEEAFTAASLANAKGVREHEPGNLRFDLNQSETDPSHFIIVETYKTLEDVAAHKETEHYKIWRAAVADMMAKPREGMKFKPC